MTSYTVLCMVELSTLETTTYLLYVPMQQSKCHIISSQANTFAVQKQLVNRGSEYDARERRSVQQLRDGTVEDVVAFPLFLCFFEKYV